MNVKSNIGRACTSTTQTSAGTVLNASAGRVGGLVQNLGTNKLYVKLGTGASTTDFTVILAPGSAADDGYGGSFPLDGWTGAVSIDGTSPRAQVSEIIG